MLKIFEEIFWRNNPLCFLSKLPTWQIFIIAIWTAESHEVRESILFKYNMTNQTFLKPADNQMVE